ncbi:hypothetical protein COCNU_03G015980 [Cocos nucifera]|uniref:Uncharacterized protein n=1 Tax=Cocos nucifera TaxID=13894 RepID=A0A8K0I4M5_COCNU|nr:hypothetical protein COCNU_03G015980 [Cocos nucifera]
MLPKTFLLLYLLLLSTSSIPLGMAARNLAQDGTVGQRTLVGYHVGYRALAPKTAVPTVPSGRPYSRPCKGNYYCRVPPVP